MPARFPSARTLLVSCLAWFSAWAHGAPSTDADAELIYGRYRTTEHSHGLYEIWQAADAFVADSNRKHKTRLRAIGPDLRIMVPACRLPLTVRWTPRAHGERGTGVNVYCTRSVDPRQRQWDIFVPVYVPHS